MRVTSVSLAVWIGRDVKPFKLHGLEEGAQPLITWHSWKKT